MQSFRELVQQELDRRKWNVYDLARESGINQPTLFRWLKRDADLRSSNLEKVFDALGLEARRKREGK